MKKLILTLSFISLVGMSYSFACPSCAATMEKDNASKSNQQKVEGYQYSIMGMMTMPFLMVSGFAFYLTRKIRKNQKHSSN